MKKKYKIALTIIFLLLVIAITLFAIVKFIPEKEEKVPAPTNNVEVLESIDSYGYTLEDRDTALYRNVYQELNEILKQEPINNEDYAIAISKLFVIDFLTISNKVTKYDVGGYDFIYEAKKEDFKNKAIDTVYKLVEDNSYDTRKQELPKVKEIVTSEVKKGTFTLNKEKKDAYIVSITWSYEKDLGYDKNATITIIEDGEKLSIVSYTTK